MKKIVFLAFSDMHANDWTLAYPYGGNRLNDSLKALEIVGSRANKLRVPILFSGDLVHKPKSIENHVLEGLCMGLKNVTQIIGIDGNHDQSKANTHKNKSPGYFTTLSKLNRKIVSISDGIPVVVGDSTMGYMVHGIPYMKNNVGFRTYLKRHITKVKENPEYKHILLIHTDLPGAINDYERKLETAENIKSLKVFKDFDLVLCGHIHKPQVLSDKIIMVGAPYQQNIGEMGKRRGYWEIYEDLTYEFIPITTIPTYRHYDVDNPPKDFSKHIYVPKPKLEITQEKTSTEAFSVSNSRVGIAKEYLKVKGEKKKSRRLILLNLIKGTI